MPYVITRNPVNGSLPMPSPETHHFDENQEKAVKAIEEKRLLAERKHEYEDLIRKSTLGKDLKRSSLDWLRLGRNFDGREITVKDVETAISYIKEHERSSGVLVKAYERKIKDYAEQGLFSKNKDRQKEYMNWFIDLPYEDRNAPMDKIRAISSSSLDDSMRQETLKLWKLLPSATKKLLQKKYDNNGMEDNNAWVKELLRKHEAQKARFLQLPKKVQDVYRKQFKDTGDLDEREKFMNWVEKERALLAAQYRRKIQQKQQPDETGLNLLSDVPEHISGSSAAEYMKWFETKLTVEQMQKIVVFSHLEKRQREDYRKQMAGILQNLPPSKQSEVRREFNAAELTGRKKLIDKYIRGADDSHAKIADIRAKKWAREKARETILSNSGNELRTRVETFAIMNEAVTERQRAEFRYHVRTVEGLQRAANDNDLRKSREAGKALAETADNLGPKKQTEQTDEFHLKTEELRLKQDVRWQMKKKFRPRVENPNAILTNVHLLKKTGDEMLVDEFKRTELAKAQNDVKELLKNALTAKADASGVRLNEKTMDEALDETDLTRLGKEVLKKAA